MPKLTNSTEVFITKLQALYDIEGELKKALPKLAKTATDPSLRKSFRGHLEETSGHSRRLEKAFQFLGLKPKKLKSEGVRGIVKDGAWVIDLKAPPFIKDAMLASSAIYAEHYEMAGYMSAIEMSKLLGHENIAKLLAETLKEEEKADQKLALLLRNNMNEE